MYLELHNYKNLPIVLHQKKLKFCIKIIKIMTDMRKLTILSGNSDNNFLYLVNEDDKGEYNIAVLQGFYGYYKIADFFGFLLNFLEFSDRFLVFCEKTSQKLITLLKVDRKKEEFLKKARSVDQISTFDRLEVHFIKDYSFESDILNHIYNRFIDRGINDECVLCISSFAEKQNDPYTVTFGCGHSFHVKCAMNMNSWMCPLCRGAIFNVTNSNCCVVCSSPNHLYSCITCLKTFCSVHCDKHFKEVGHPYVLSIDSMESFNLLLDESLKRLALEKDGEIVEMCSKSEDLGEILTKTSEFLFRQHTQSNDMYIMTQKSKKEEKLNDLMKILEEKRAKLDNMKEVIESRGNLMKKIRIQENYLKSLRNENYDDIPQLEEKNLRLREELESSKSVLNDISFNLILNKQSGIQFTIKY